MRNPRHQTKKLQERLQEIKDRVREGIGKVGEPPLKATFEASAKALGGLIKELPYGHTVVGMLTILSALVSLLSLRLRSRAFLELELVALRHQVTVLRRKRPVGFSCSAQTGYSGYGFT